MNRAEQKERLSGIIDNLENTISAIESNKAFYSEVVAEYSKIQNMLNDEGHIDILENSLDEFSTSLIVSIVNNQADFESTLEELEEFKDEIESYADELSESRAEKLMERFGDLEEVYDALDSLTDGDGESLTLDTVSNELTEKIVWLKEMKK